MRASRRGHGKLNKLSFVRFFAALTLLPLQFSVGQWWTCSRALAPDLLVAFSVLSFDGVTPSCDTMLGHTGII